jgi:hypothetical protein
MHPLPTRSLYLCKYLWILNKMQVILDNWKGCHLPKLLKKELVNCQANNNEKQNSNKMKLNNNKQNK